MRLFIAIRLDRHIRDGLESIQLYLRDNGIKGNFTKIENLHLTLAFIGEYPDPEYVLDAMRQISFQPFELALDGFGAFGDLYWVGIRADNQKLENCVKRLRRTLSENAIPFDRKKFVPHITLIRRACFDSKRGFPGDIPIPGDSMRVNYISLMRSDRGKNGMIYTKLGDFSAK